MPELDKRDLLALGTLPTQLITRYRKYHVHRREFQIKVSVELVHRAWRGMSFVTYVTQGAHRSLAKVTQ
jgi:hypothetical protein